MTRPAFFAAVTTVLLVWLLFWFAIGRGLEYDVYAGPPNDMQYLYSEEWTLSGRLIITTLVAVAAGVVALAIAWLTQIGKDRKAAVGG